MLWPARKIRMWKKNTVSLRKIPENWFYAIKSHTCFVFIFVCKCVHSCFSPCQYYLNVKMTARARRAVCEYSHSIHRQQIYALSSLPFKTNTRTNPSIICFKSTIVYSIFMCVFLVHVFYTHICVTLFEIGHNGEYNVMVSSLLVLFYIILSKW